MTFVSHVRKGRCYKEILAELSFSYNIFPKLFICRLPNSSTIKYPINSKHSIPYILINDVNEHYYKAVDLYSDSICILNVYMRTVRACAFGV